MTSRERLTLTLLALASAALRVLAFFRYRFDSDEAQHLHIAWGWTAGLLQYRDVFDNHTPLFHIITAPVLKALGEREDIQIWMRVPMLVLFALVIWATYVLGRRIYSTRVGAWSALLLSLLPPFFLKSVEYRTDNLWNTLWCLVLVALVGAARSNLHLFVAGLLLGCALATSMKTSLLMLTLAAAAVMARIAFRRGDWRGLIPIVIGIPIVPAIILAYFASQGALSNLVYCVITFNELLTQTRSPLSLWLPRALWIPLIVVTVVVAWRFRPRDDSEQSRMRFFLAFACAFYFVTLCGFWILISPRDTLPCLPLLAIFIVAAIGRAKKATFVYVATAVVFVAGIVYYADGFRNHTREITTMMHQALGLTRPGEPVMDLKGETVYRPRPFYYVFEYITRNAMDRGLIADTIPEDVIRTQCHIAEADGPFFPPRARAFLSDNFLDMGRLRAAGKWIGSGSPFTIAVAGSYVVIDAQGQIDGKLDGVPYRGPRYLPAGSHVFEAAKKEYPLAVLWAPAFQRGYSPYRRQDMDF